MKISCIIPAYNEAERIGRVLETVTQVSGEYISEIIVVDDGSRDNTEHVVGKFPQVCLITQQKNQGKSMAVYRGIKESVGDAIILLDADLVGLTPKNIADLIEPVFHDKADVSISLRKISLIADLFYRIVGMDILSGERVFKRSIIAAHLEDIAGLPRFGIETFFNKIIINSQSRVTVVWWNNVRSPLKSSKRGFVIGIIADIRMFGDILRTISLPGILRQIWKLRRQIV